MQNVLEMNVEKIVENQDKINKNIMILATHIENIEKELSERHKYPMSDNELLDLRIDIFQIKLLAEAAKTTLNGLEDVVDGIQQRSDEIYAMFKEEKSPEDAEEVDNATQ